MGKMKEIAISMAQLEITKDARNLAEATLRLTQAVQERFFRQQMPAELSYPLDDAEGEAKSILAKTQGA